MENEVIDPHPLIHAHLKKKMITINPIREFEFRNRIIIPFRSLDSWIRMICFILLDVHLFFFSFFSFRTLSSQLFHHALPHHQSSIVLQTTIVQKDVWKFYLFSILYFYLRSLCETRGFELFFITSKRTPSLLSCPGGWSCEIFFFFFLFACALQKHGISLSITILKLYIH